MAEVLYDEINLYGPVRDALNALSLRADDARLYPLPIDAVRGVSVGGCVEAIGTDRQGAFRRSAHAHNRLGDPWLDWVCFRSAKRVLTPSGKATDMLIHEVAHLIRKGSHGPGWKKAVIALGAPAEAKRYEAYQARIAAKRGKLVPCPVEAAGETCPYTTSEPKMKPGHRHSERLIIFAGGKTYATPMGGA